MKRTNKQVISAIEKLIEEFGCDTIELYDSFYQYWIKYNLTQEQCLLLEDAKKWRE